MSHLQLPDSLTTSPSQSTFMAEEDASICPLLPNTSSPNLHPLTPSTVNDIPSDAPDDQGENDDSSSSSSGIGMNMNIGRTSYHHLSKNGDTKAHPENGTYGTINYEYLNMLNIPLTKDMPSFIGWNWPLIRKLTFFIFLSFIVAMAAAVVGMVYNMPKTCMPKTAWYQGSVFYEIFPASFKDSTESGIGDLKGIANKVEYFKNLSIGAIRLNSIFASPNYPENYESVESLMEVSKGLGTVKDLENLAKVLNDQNISLVLDLPLHPIYQKLEPVSNSSAESHVVIGEYQRLERSVIDENRITSVIKFWLSKGVKGFYLKGLENFADDQYLGENMREWNYHLKLHDSCLIVSEELINRLNDDELAAELLEVIDLVDVKLDVTNGTQHIEKQVVDTLNGKLKPTINGPWIHWSLNGVEKSSRVATKINPNISLASVLMQIMLPGTPSIFYGDEISVGKANDDSVESKHLHHLPTMSFSGRSNQQRTLPWLPKSTVVNFQHLEYVTDAIAVRRISPSIYKNSVTRAGEDIANFNTHIRANKNDLLIVERTYPRRNTFVSVTNFGSQGLTVDISAFYYSGELVVGPMKKNQVYFNNFRINAYETLLVKLDK